MTSWLFSQRAARQRSAPISMLLTLLSVVAGVLVSASLKAESAPVTIQLRPPPLPPAQAAVLAAADELLELALVSYVYGGSQVGDGAACTSCNSCLETAKPAPSARLKACPICRDCSLDCSHFTQLVLQTAGFPHPYIETASMLALSADALARRYGLIEVDTDALSALARLQPGDLLVYKGHVVMLERLHRIGVDGRPKGDIVHATGGRDIKAPGQGIQRERYADLANFRGPLLRVLRHKGLQASSSARSTLQAPPAVTTEKPSSPTPARRLRRVAKDSPGPQNGD